MDEGTIREIIERFQNDILYDCHSLSARYGRSEAVRALLEMGIEAVPVMIAFLADFSSPTAEPGAENDLKRAWTWILDDMSVFMDDHPGSLHFDGWVEWAKRRVIAGQAK